jgi:membrane protease YdiL (CAAX protease family)
VAFLACAEVLLVVAGAWCLTLLLVLPVLPRSPEGPGLVPDRESVLDLGPRLPALLAIQAAVFLLVGWILSARRVTPPGPPRVAPPLAALAGVAAGIVTLVASAILGFALDRLGLPVEEQVWVRDLLGAREMLLPALPWMVLGGPLAEEVFFRRYVFRFLSENAGLAAGYVGSSVLFGAIHLNPSGLPVYVLIGLAFAWLYRRTGSLWAPVVAHATLNGAIVLVAVASGGA